jgi:sensor histidine kinase YesM
MSAFSMLALQSGEMQAAAKQKGFMSLVLKQLGQMFVIVIFVFNVVWIVSRIPAVKAMSFIRHHAVIILTIVVSATAIYATINYVDNGMKFKNLHGTLVYAYFNAIVTGFIYTGFNYVELERKRKLNEKELEVTRLIALKTKAELDALHSKVNPHFLYNALNSIADLSITDGRKARKMTIALADLFRYSINYSQNNYSTVTDEIAMTDVYLQIEKIRFEDQLNYTVNVEPDAGFYLVPRFLLQPLVENAVKHGLKATGRMTEIFLEVRKQDEGLVIDIADNGPAFPDELNPGYGVKSVFDKLDLLFPGQYEIRFSNQPRKEVSIHIHKLIKNEPGV